MAPGNTMQETKPSTLKSALDYARIGWSVIPIVERGKRPLVRWAPYQNSRATEAEIRQWWSQWPNANVGVITGSISNLIVLDVDVRHGGDDSLADLERRHGAFPKSVEAITGGGGRHIYFRHPAGTVRNKVGMAAGLDLRGDGGLVVAPPSIHTSGRRYAWRKSHDPSNTPMLAIPGWLLRLATEESGPHGHPLRHWRDVVATGVTEGERNTTIASLAGYLFWHGLDPQVVLDLLLCWNAERCRPPLPEDEVARTVVSIARLHAQETSSDRRA
jgi:hypothetical protein